jgi:L-ascorbate metabolism protein UlaG (beta-lactamase superfamily)
MKNDVTFRWLGVCGIELTSGKTTLLIDPYFTRLKAHFLWLGRPVSNAKVIRRNITKADHILITHSHFDHMLDVAEIIDQTGAIAHGSPNTIELLRRCGVPKSQVRLIEPGVRLRFGDFEVEALEAGLHSPPGYGPGSLRSQYRLPLRASDYRMDTVMAYKIQTSGLRILFEHCLKPEQALPVDILFLEPYAGIKRTAMQQYRKLIHDFQPTLVVPIHSDDMMMPLHKPMVGQMLPQRKVFFPLGRFNFHSFKQTIEQIRPQTRVFLPVRLEEYGLKEILASSRTPRSLLTSFSLIKIHVLRFVSRDLALVRNLQTNKV